MELKELLLKSIQDRYFANLKIKGIEKEIETPLNIKLFEQYEDSVLTRNGLTFKLIKVSTKLNNWSDNTLNINDVEIRLFFICNSRLPKNKRDKLSEYVECLNKHGRFPYCNFKIPIYHELRYSTNIDDVLSGNIHLEIY